MIIAEAATCHGGSVEEAMKLSKKAKEIGVDVIKFQLIDPRKLYNRWITINGSKKINDTILTREKEQLTRNQWDEVISYCQEIDLKIAFTIFDVESVEYLVSKNPPFIKIASGDLNYLDLLKEVGQSNCDIILSTGMAQDSEISEALSTLNCNNNEALTLMHCVSIYPCPIERAGLSRIAQLQKFQIKIGFSDHTLGNWASSVAKVLGVKTFEKHFKLKDGPRTPDWNHSLDETEFADYVGVIKYLETEFNLVQYNLSPEEVLTRSRARRGVYFSRDLEKGQIISKDDLVFLRPMTEMAMKDTQNIIGKEILLTVEQGDEAKIEYF